MKKNNIYYLKHDSCHSGDSDIDAFHVPFDDSELFGAKMLGIDNFFYPKKIYFQANFNVIPQIDYPTTDLTVNIMSAKMLNIILNIGQFKYSTIPLIMFDDTYLGNRFKEDGTLKDEIKKYENYIALHLLEYTNAFDYDLSKYKMKRAFPDKVGIIDNLILTEPLNGFPPIFKIKEMAWELFITEETKMALEKNNIKGCLFNKV